MILSDDIYKFKDAMCGKYERMCFTRKCPLRHIGCFDQTLHMAFSSVSKDTRKEFFSIVEKAMISEGWK